VDIGRILCTQLKRASARWPFAIAGLDLILLSIVAPAAKLKYEWKLNDRA
jgi:hypothetical protein